MTDCTKCESQCLSCKNKPPKDLMLIPIELAVRIKNGDCSPDVRNEMVKWVRDA